MNYQDTKHDIDSCMDAGDCLFNFNDKKIEKLNKLIGNNMEGKNY